MINQNWKSRARAATNFTKGLSEVEQRSEAASAAKAAMQAAMLAGQAAWRGVRQQQHNNKTYGSAPKAIGGTNVPGMTWDDPRVQLALADGLIEVMELTNHGKSREVSMALSIGGRIVIPDLSAKGEPTLRYTAGMRWSLEDDDVSTSTTLEILENWSNNTTAVKVWSDGEAVSWIQASEGIVVQLPVGLALPDIPEPFE